MSMRSERRHHLNHHVFSMLIHAQHPFNVSLYAYISLFAPTTLLVHPYALSASRDPTGDATSFNSQPTYVVPMTTSKGEQYFMYMADNWVCIIELCHPRRDHPKTSANGWIAGSWGASGVD